VGRTLQAGHDLFRAHLVPLQVGSTGGFLDDASDETPFLVPGAGLTPPATVVRPFG
jgi:hypothetical protein